MTLERTKMLVWLQAAIIPGLTDDFISGKDSNGRTHTFPRADLIAPDDPSLGPWSTEKGWELLSRTSALSNPPHWESVTLRRPLAPPWKPEPGQRAWWEAEQVNVDVVDVGSTRAVVLFDHPESLHGEIEVVALLSDLSPPRPEGGAP